jgi:hypothetical protein
MIYVIIATTKQRRERLTECLAALRESTVPHSVVIYENLDGGCCLATTKALEGINAPVFILNDDMIVEPDCIEKLYNAYTQDELGVYQPWENMHGGKLAVSPFGFSEVLKPFLKKGYVHSFWDTELTIMATAYGKYHIVAEAKIDHKHVMKDPSLQDATYKISQDKLAFDTELFNKRKAKQFND